MKTCSGYLGTSLGGVLMQIILLVSWAPLVSWSPLTRAMTLGDISANYNIRSSRLPNPGREFALDKVSFSVGQIVTGGCQFSIGRKDALVNISKQDYGYLAKLQWIEQRYVVLWDEEDKCGWLVKGTSALLHLLRASLEHCRKDKFSSGFLFKQDAF